MVVGTCAVSDSTNGAIPVTIPAVLHHRLRTLYAQHEYHPQTQRLIRSTNPDGSNKTLTYDRAGNLTSETNELGVTTRHEYDALNRRIKTTLDLNGNQAPDATYSNATLPNRTETLNTDSPLIEYDGDLLTLNNYNARGQVTRSLSPGNIETLNTYDGIGRLIQTIS